MPSQLKLITDRLENPIVKDNFQRVQEEFRKGPFAAGDWVFYELEFSGSVTNYKYQHNLEFQPRDAFITSRRQYRGEGPGVVTFDYDLFTRDNIDISTTDAVIVRFFLGAYFEETGA